MGLNLRHLAHHSAAQFNEARQLPVRNIYRGRYELVPAWVFPLVLARVHHEGLLIIFKLLCTGKIFGIRDWNPVMHYLKAEISIYIYIYIYIERERERDIDMCVCVCVCIYIYIYIYICENKLRKSTSYIYRFCPIRRTSIYLYIYLSHC